MVVKLQPKASRKINGAHRKHNYIHLPPRRLKLNVDESHFTSSWSWTCDGLIRDNMVNLYMVLCVKLTIQILLQMKYGQFFFLVFSLFNLVSKSLWIWFNVVISIFLISNMYLQTSFTFSRLLRTLSTLSYIILTKTKIYKCAYLFAHRAHSTSFNLNVMIFFPFIRHSHM